MPYLTPETDSEDTVCFSITVPNTQGFRIVAVGLLEELYQLHNWEEFGMTRQATIARLKELNPLYYGTCEDIMSCADVADCIETDVNVQNVVNTLVLNQGIVDPNTIDPDNTVGADRIPSPETTPIAPPPPACDLDELWAGIREMVDRIDQNGRDILEDLQFINDKIEQWGEIIDLVPLLGDTIKDIGDLFTAQIPDLLNAYNSASSPTFLDNVACDLFEMVCGECRYPTFDEIINYFGSLTPFQLPAFATMSYGSMWSLIKTVSSAVPEPVWYTINVWQCITLAFDGTFKRSHGRKSFEVWASFGEDNPNNNWEILCGDCGTWFAEFDASNFGDGRWQLYPAPNNTGFLQDGIWHAGQIPSAPGLELAIEALFSNSVTVTRIEVDYQTNETFATGTDKTTFAAVRTPTNAFFVIDIPFGPDIVNYTQDYAGTVCTERFYFTMGVRKNGTTPDGSYGFVSRIRIEGTGNPPNWST